jgi:hypothetical protein
MMSDDLRCFEELEFGSTASFDRVDWLIAVRDPAV